MVNYAPEVGLDAPIFDGSGIALAGDTYVAELYGGKWASSLTPAYYAIATNRVRVPFLTGSGSGYFNTYQGVGIRDTVGGESVWLQIRVWNTRLGATYEEVATRGLGGFGESNLFYARGGGGSNIPEPPASLIGLQSFKLRPPVSGPCREKTAGEGCHEKLEQN